MIEDDSRTLGSILSFKHLLWSLRGLIFVTLTNFAFLFLPAVVVFISWRWDFGSKTCWSALREAIVILPILDLVNGWIRLLIGSFEFQGSVILAIVMVSRLCVVREGNS